jgi:hypothetical protein
MVWDRLLGCFGDALLRKFGAEPPNEWSAVLGAVTAAQLERGMRRLVFGWKGGPPTLPDFMRLCRTVGNDEFDDGQPPPLQLTGPDTFAGDVWDIAANRYLLGHIAKRMSANPKMYGKPASYEAMQASVADLNQLGLDKHNLDASGEFVDNVHKLIGAKKEWAADMRDIAVKGEVPVDTQKQFWREYMQRAEAAL